MQNKCTERLATSTERKAREREREVRIEKNLGNKTMKNFNI